MKSLAITVQSTLKCQASKAGISGDEVPSGCATGGDYPWRAGRGASGAAATWPGPLRPRLLLFRAVIHSLLGPWAPFPDKRRARRLGVQCPRTCEKASRSSAPLGTLAHAMADSERFSAPGCWAACTNFARTLKGILLFAEIVRVPELAGGQRRGVVAGSCGTGQPWLRKAHGPRRWAVGLGEVG